MNDDSDDNDLLLKDQFANWEIKNLQVFPSKMTEEPRRNGNHTDTLLKCVFSSKFKSLEYRSGNKEYLVI